jgi:hypothetical protein
MIPASANTKALYSIHLFSLGLKCTRIRAPLNLSFRPLKAVIASSVHLNYSFPFSKAIIPSATKLY